MVCTIAVTSIFVPLITKFLILMKKLIFTVLTVSLFTIACKQEKKAEAPVEVAPVVEQTTPAVLLEGATHTADVAASSLTWKGFKPTGSHNGTLSLKEGAVVADSTGIKQGVFVLDMTTLKVLDIPADAKENADLSGHLASPDFFDVANHPTATFSFNELKDNKLTGELTIKGITKPLTIPVSVSEVDGVTTLKAAPFKVDRTAYDIKFKSKKFFGDLGDKFINDEFEVSFDVKLKK